MFVKIFKLENVEETLTTFGPGTHIIGRGTALKCNDKRVSRNHATLEVTGEIVTLTSIHVNPCFLRTVNSKTITILANNSSSQLRDGDAFAFLPDEFWFKIKICEEDLTSPIIVKEEENTTKGDLKRYLSDPEQGTSEKKIKVENSNLIEISVKEEEVDHELEYESNTYNKKREQGTSEKKIRVENNDLIEIMDHELNTHNIKTEQGTSEKQIKVENCDSIETSVKQEKMDGFEKNVECKAELNNTVNIKTEDPTIKEEENCTTNNMDNGVNSSLQSTVVEEDNEQMADKNTCTESINTTENMPSIDDQSTSSNGEKKEEIAPDETAAGTSKVKSKRERCWYGAQCYRKNPQHRDDFSHPGDSDFESDLEDDRPTCSYGAACYRKNKEHRRSHKHPPKKPPNQKTKRIRKKVDRLNVADYEDSDLSDLSDDPYAADGDSDEYVQDSDSDDTDWEDSQNVDENSENVRRMVKEAKRFMKK